MSYDIKQELIPNLPKTPYRNGVGAWEGIVNHSTDTPNASAQNERDFEANNWNNAFVHFFVDDVSIIQVADTNYKAWGAGANANPRFIHIELCEFADATRFKNAYDRYVWLTVHLLVSKGMKVIDGVTVWSHAEVTAKLGGTTHTDPINFLASHGISWGQHIGNLQAEYNRQVEPAPTPTPASTSKTLFKVQCGAFKVKTNATDLSNSLKAKGYVNIIVYENTLYKVQVGAFSVKQNADNLMNQLKAKGFSAFIIQE